MTGPFHHKICLRPRWIEQNLIPPSFITGVIDAAPEERNPVNCHFGL